jgi:hypothetical protein
VKKPQIEKREILLLTFLFSCQIITLTTPKINTSSINDCNTSLGKDAIHRVSTNSLFVALFFQIGINYSNFCIQYNYQIWLCLLKKSFHSRLLGICGEKGKGKRGKRLIKTLFPLTCIPFPPLAKITFARGLVIGDFFIWKFLVLLSKILWGCLNRLKYSLISHLVEYSLSVGNLPNRQEL